MIKVVEKTTATVLFCNVLLSST